MSDATSALQPAATLMLWRQVNDLTLAQAADACGVNPVAFHRWEHGSRQVDPKLVNRVSRVTGVPRGTLNKYFAEETEQAV